MLTAPPDDPLADVDDPDGGRTGDDAGAAPRRTAGSPLPVLETLVLMALVSVLGWLLGVAGAGGPRTLALGPAAFVRPWTVLTSVYAHAGVRHLVANAVLVGLAGTPVALSTSRRRFHAYVVGTGVLSGVAHVVASGLVAQPAAVLGASGAAFALVGYVLAANPVATAVFGWLEIPTRVAVAAGAVVALLVGVVGSGPGSALVSHVAGVALGLVTGRLRLLRVPPET